MRFKLLLLFFLLLPRLVLSQTAQVPHLLNYQTVLMDDNGNLITDSFIDMEFKILDQNGNQLYYESQPGVQVVKSAMNIMIGEGLTPGTSSPTGGIPLSALDPTTGIKSLQVKIGNNQPSDPMEMGMVPYAMYAEEALTVAKDAITSKEIKDGSIKAADLDPTINFSALAGQISESQLPSTVTLDTELNAHINSTTAHPATAITVVGPFTFTQATNLQQILKDLDSNLLNEVANRIISRDNLNTALNNAQTSLQGSITTLSGGNLTAKVNRSGDTITGNLTLSGGNIIMAGTETVDGIDISAVLSNINNIPGTLNDNKIASTITRDSEVISILNNLPSGSTISGTKIDSIASIPGILTDSQIPSTITRDSEVMTIVNTATGSFSGWDTNEGNDFLTDGSRTISCNAAPLGRACLQINGDVVAGFFSGNGSGLSGITLQSLDTTTPIPGGGQSIDSRYVNATGGDVMSGVLNMGGNNITNVGTVDGITLGGANGLGSRVTRLEGDNVNFNEIQGQATTTQIPQFMRPFAFASVDFRTAAPPPASATISTQYNISSSAPSSNNNGICTTFGMAVTINFQNPVSPADANYIVMMSPTTAVVNKTASGFVLCENAARPGVVDILVLHP